MFRLLTMTTWLVLAGCFPQGPDHCDPDKGPTCLQLEMSLRVTGAERDEITCDSGLSTAARRTESDDDGTPVWGSCVGPEPKDGGNAQLGYDIWFEPAIESEGAEEAEGGFGPGQEGGLAGAVMFVPEGEDVTNRLALAPREDEVMDEDDEERYEAFADSACSMEVEFAPDGSSTGKLACSDMLPYEYDAGEGTVVVAGDPVNIDLRWEYVP